MCVAPCQQYIAQIMRDRAPSQTSHAARRNSPWEACGGNSGLFGVSAVGSGHGVSDCVHSCNRTLRNGAHSRRCTGLRAGARVSKRASAPGASFRTHAVTSTVTSGRHTIPNPKRKPKSERWSPETATTPMPKPTVYGTRPHPLTFYSPGYHPCSALGFTLPAGTPVRQHPHKSPLVPALARASTPPVSPLLLQFAQAHREASARLAFLSREARPDTGRHACSNALPRAQI